MNDEKATIIEKWFKKDGMFICIRYFEGKAFSVDRFEKMPFVNLEIKPINWDSLREELK